MSNVIKLPWVDRVVPFPLATGSNYASFKKRFGKDDVNVVASKIAEALPDTTKPGK